MKTVLESLGVFLCRDCPGIEDRDEVEVGNWVKHKKTFYSECVRDLKEIKSNFFKQIRA
jgi:hypothetical protein